MVRLQQDREGRRKKRKLKILHPEEDAEDRILNLRHHLQNLQKHLLKKHPEEEQEEPERKVKL
jgi:formate dehydrogenase maturation protein FdhE